jgi:hypothetical protein
MIPAELGLVLAIVFVILARGVFNSGDGEHEISNE